MFELNILLGMKGRSNEQEGSTTSALSIFAERPAIMQPCFGYGYYVAIIMAIMRHNNDGKFISCVQL